MKHIGWNIVVKERGFHKEAMVEYTGGVCACSATEYVLSRDKCVHGRGFVAFAS